MDGVRSIYSKYHYSVLTTSENFPPSTPLSTTTDGSDDQIDELMLQSTPNTEPAPIVELFNSQMGLSLPFLLTLN